MANPRGQQDLGDLAFTPAEAAAIAQAEVMGQAAPPPVPRRRRWGRSLGMVLLACAGFFLLFYEPWQPQPTTPMPAASEVIKSGATIAIARKRVHLRSEPSIASSSLGVIPAGSPLTVTEQRFDGFHRVNYGAQVGYAAGAYLTVVSGVELIRPTDGRVGAVSGAVRLRERPSLAATLIAGLLAATPIQIIGYTQSGWVLVAAQSRTGFLWGGLIDASPALPFQPGRDGPDAVVVFGGRIIRPSTSE